MSEAGRSPATASTPGVGDVDAVIDLLERWRDATGVGRLRIGIDATRVIGQLPPARKRALAVEVAERVAPQLVPAIEAESGDLTVEQVGALVDLLRRAEREQLDELVTALRTGEIGEAADILDEAVDVVAGPDDETDALLEDIATEDETTPIGAAAAVGMPATDGALPPPTGRPRGDDGSGNDVEGDDTEDVMAGSGGAGLSATAAAAAAAERDHVRVSEDGSLELDEEAVRERLAEEAAQRAQQYRDSSADAPRAPAYRAPDVDFITEDAEFEFPDTTVEPVAPLHERLDRRGRGVAPRHGLAAAPVSASVASITATPDGYRRRRAAMDAIRGARLDADDVTAVVRSFDRGTDRAWVAGAALDADLVDASALDDLELSSAAVARLRRRVR